VTYDVPVAPGEKAELEERVEGAAEGWPMWEVHRGGAGPPREVDAAPPVRLPAPGRVDMAGGGRAVHGPGRICNQCVRSGPFSS
jgi:hypothetical protein